MMITFKNSISLEDAQYGYKTALRASLIGKNHHVSIRPPYENGKHMLTCLLRPQGKKLATPYSRAILEMVPTHNYPENRPRVPLEPFNEIHVHGYTMQQLFVPTSESRHFTREDAAKAFHHTMLSADDRIPHKELVQHRRRVHEGMRERESEVIFKEEARKSQQNDEDRVKQAEEHEKRLTQTVPTARFEFRFKKMAVDDVGKTGRARSGVGWRYGFPYEDRKRDQVKIPTKMN